jgi:hypothetical protein
MKVQLLIITGDENAGGQNVLGHGMDFEMPSVPRAGDLVTVSHPDQEGQTWFVVRRTIWSLDHPGAAGPYRADTHPTGAPGKVILECEFAVGPYQSEEHKDELACPSIIAVSR